jgi:hypothetical protein
MTPSQPSETPSDLKQSFSDLLADLQRENLRLQRIVSELLFKNQQLRSDS